MSGVDLDPEFGRHSHVFLGLDHEQSERRTWAVIVLCGLMMFAEIVGGLLFGSIALVADGLHMSTHAGALLLAALAYSYARKHAHDARFTFGTGKLGDLAGFTSAIVLAMIALLIGYESIKRLFAPVSIHFAEAIPIACLGLGVNIASAWLLSRGGGHHHHHGDDHGHHHDHHHEHDHHEHHHSHAEAPQPLAFEPVTPNAADNRHAALSAGHDNGGAHAHRDNNMRAAVIHVAADAAVSILVIVGLSLARAFGWMWMDPLAGIVGACVIASWSYGLIRDTGAILLDMNPNRQLADDLLRIIEGGGDQLADLHLWRVGPGHLAAIVTVVTSTQRQARYYREKLRHFKILSHLTVEVRRRGAAD